MRCCPSLSPALPDPPPSQHQHQQQQQSRSHQQLQPPGPPKSVSSATTPTMRIRGPIVLVGSAAFLLLALQLLDFHLAAAAPQSASASAAIAGSCRFPKTWEGEWISAFEKKLSYINESHFGEKTCHRQIKLDLFLTLEEENGKDCYRCMIIKELHYNLISYRETSYCLPEADEEALCQLVTDDIFYSMYRVDYKPIRCPITGGPFSFSYNRGDGDCGVPESQAESCTDDTKMILKYQSCTDIGETFSEELKCLATWKEGRSFYMIAAVKSQFAQREDFGCFIYENYTNNNQSGYRIGQSGESTCGQMTSLNEAAKTYKFLREDRERIKCKFPTWSTDHHIWHSLDGQSSYHFASGNSTLRIKYDDKTEEKIVCYTVEQMHGEIDIKAPAVKLVSHVASGCDLGYVCIIFHKRDENVIEIQKSTKKALVPQEACNEHNFNVTHTPYTTLITSKLRKKSCPHIGRYSLVSLSSSYMDGSMRLDHSNKNSKQSIKREDSIIHDHENECQTTALQIGCSSDKQHELVISEHCSNNLEFTCHSSWKEKDVRYLIVSRNNSVNSEKEMLCIAMKRMETEGLPNNEASFFRHDLVISTPQNSCPRDFNNQLIHKLIHQGVCQDLTLREASSSQNAASLVKYNLLILIHTIILASFFIR